MSLLDKIPGLREAIEKESHIRDSSFIDVPERICGFDVKPLTFRHLLWLSSTANVFACGGVPEQKDIGGFFVIVGEWTGLKRYFGLKKLGRIPKADAIESISDFIAESFQDSQGSPPKDTTSYYSAAASLVDLFAGQYGWGESEILNIPVKRLFQYQNAIRARHGETVFFNPSDRVRGDWLAEQNRLAIKN
jgi:hypothetical protein